MQDIYEEFGHPLPVYNGAGEQTLPFPPPS